MAIDLVNTSLFEFSIIFSCHDVHKRIFFQSLIALPYSQFQSFSILSLLEFLFMIYLCNIYHLLEIPWTLSEGVFIFCFIFWLLLNLIMCFWECWIQGMVHVPCPGKKGYKLRMMYHMELSTFMKEYAGAEHWYF